MKLRDARSRPTLESSFRPADRDPAASGKKKVMLELLEKARMLGVPPVSQCRTGDNVSTVGINLPHLRAEIKAIHESGATWHQRSAINAKGFQPEQRRPASSKEEEEAASASGHGAALKRTSQGASCPP